MSVAAGRTSSGILTIEHSVVRRVMSTTALLLAALPARVLPAQWAPPDTVLPAGTRVSVRLLDRVIGTPAARGARVCARVIAPTRPAERPVGGLAPGDTVCGVVRDAGMEQGRGHRHFATLAFDRVALAGRDAPSLPLAARVADVPDARESVDTAGRIVGPKRPGIWRSPIQWAAALLGAEEPLAGAFFFAAFDAERRERHRRIEYAPGVELTLALTAPLSLPARPTPSMPSAPASVADALRGAPWRVLTVKERLPADLFTVALVGSEAEVTNAFRASGWTVPERSRLRGDLATLAAAARARGFGAQPFTTLYLGGRPPVLAFEKVVNSMVMRHHVRLWRWGDASDGRPLWLAAATRDVGMRFSRARHAFTHRIDPAVDAERDKIVDDLGAESAVAACSYVTRTPPAQPVFVNDGTTPVVTDWRLAVLVLRPVGVTAGWR